MANICILLLAGVASLAAGYPGAVPLMPQPGPYCGITGECCQNRQDSCAHRTLDTVCYCDEFCDHLNRIHNDCCPDYVPVCRNESLPLPPQTITDYRRHRGKRSLLQQTSIGIVDPNGNSVENGVGNSFVSSNSNILVDSNNNKFMSSNGNTINNGNSNIFGSSIDNSIEKGNGNSIGSSNTNRLVNSNDNSVQSSNDNSIINSNNNIIESGNGNSIENGTGNSIKTGNGNRIVNTNGYSILSGNDMVVVNGVVIR